MRVLATRNTFANGQQLTAGEVYVLDPEAGRQLIQMGKATEAPEQTTCPNGSCGVKPASRRKKANAAE
jgi:hypothetical protein